MMLKSVTIILVVKVILGQAQNTASEIDVNNPFFQKFFQEFQKQYEELQKKKNEITPAPLPTTFEQNTAHSNPFLFPQSTTRPKISNKRPSRRPTINPLNPYFTAPADSIRPTRRPHINPFLRTTTSTETTISSQNSFVGLPIEVRKESESNNRQPQFLKERFQDTAGDHLDTKTDFLSFVHSALTASPKRQRTQVSTEQRNSAQSVPNLVKQLVNIAPKSRVDNTQARAGQEIISRPREDVFTTKSKPRNNYDEEEFRKQAASAKYSFASDVQDNINGNLHQRQEQREGNKVTGMYTYEDGFFRRTVHYEADDKGYRVVKEDVQEIGDGPIINPDGSAKVKSYVAGNVVDYQVTNEDILRRKPIQYRAVEEPGYEYQEK